MGNKQSFFAKTKLRPFSDDFLGAAFAFYNASKSGSLNVEELATLVKHLVKGYYHFELVGM